jgi:DNA-binding HxlR family transcriptional regulator
MDYARLLRWMQTDAMKSYGQYCPIARASEVFAERWTPLIVRNIFLGCETFSAIQAGAPGIPRSLLRQRLGLLEQIGVVARVPKASGRGARYVLTEAGKELWEVCDALGRWGTRWLEAAPWHLDPYIVLWSFTQGAKTERLPVWHVTARLDFLDQPLKNRHFWLVIDRGDIELCVSDPGYVPDVIVIAETEAFARWYMGQLSWAEVLRAGRVSIQGPRALTRAFPTWTDRSRYAPLEAAMAAEHRRHLGHSLHASRLDSHAISGGVQAAPTA